MLEKDKKKYGLLVCALTGIIILMGSLLYSKLDIPQLSEDSLVSFANDWNITTEQNAFDITVDLPENTPEVSLGDTMILTNTLPETTGDHTYLFFRASHQNIRVLIDGEEVYTFGWNENRIFGKTPACAWILVPLSREDQGATIQVEITGIYQRYTNMVNTMAIGDKQAVIYQILMKRLGSVFLCLCLFIIGTGMVIVSVALGDRKTTISLKRLGVFSIVVGCWSVCITNIVQIFYPNVFDLLTLEFLLFDMLLPLFLWFLLSFQYYRDKKWMHWAFWISILHFMLINLLQITNLADYMESLTLSHLIILVVILLIIGSGVKDLIQKKASSEVNILIMSVVVILVFAGIDMVRFYQLNVVDEGFYSRIGTLVFISLWAVAVIRSMSRRLVTIAKTEALEVLAYQDLMTGLKNRTAFEQWMTRYQSAGEKEEVYVIIFDMNGLKAINDKHGHMSGDKAINAFANTVKDAFTPYGGLCYRIGGDEICVIVDKANVNGNENISKIIRRIHNSILDASIDMNLVFTVAAGYSDVSLTEKRDILEAYRVADRLMYENKLAIKKRTLDYQTDQETT